MIINLKKEISYKIKVDKKVEDKPLNSDLSSTLY